MSLLAARGVTKPFEGLPTNDAVSSSATEGGPSLSPVDRIFEIVRDIHAQEGLTILLGEQNVGESLSLAHAGYVIRTGRTVLSGTGKELLDSGTVRKAYLGM